MRGRPLINIPEDQLSVLLEYNFSVTDIARMLQVSARTVRRRIIQYGLENGATLAPISDSQLDEISTDFVRCYAHSGRRSFQGFLRGAGLRVPMRRIRESLMRVDSRGVQQRFRRALHRRQYHVCMPNSLWHIDGMHKLIRWHIVVNAGIDGYSRLPVFIRASTNNSSETMLKCFLDGIRDHGLPSRVRCDRGGENVLVSQYMLTHPQRGPGRHSCITGRSVHNQRIERFWRDLNQACTSLFYNLFYSIEDVGLLNPDDCDDLFSLHYIFVPRLNNHLRIFKEFYSHHSLRTAGNRSPYQLWMSGMLVRSGDRSAIEGQEESITVSIYIHTPSCAVRSVLQVIQ